MRPPPPRLPVTDNSVPEFDVFLYYMSAIGGLCGILVFSILLYEVLKFYFKHDGNKSHHSRNKKEQAKKNRYLYHFVISYLVSGILICITYSFIKSNLVTRTSIKHFSITHCEIGYYLSIIFNLINRALLYSLFLYQLYIINLNQEYKQWVFNTLAASIVIQCSMAMLFVSLGPFINGDRVTWTARYDEDTGLIYCAVENDKHPAIMALKAEIATFECVFSAIFLVMFNKRLRSLRNSLMGEYVETGASEELKRTVTGHGSTGSLGPIQETEEFVTPPSKVGDAFPKSIKMITRNSASVEEEVNSASDELERNKSDSSLNLVVDDNNKGKSRHIRDLSNSLSSKTQSKKRGHKVSMEQITDDFTKQIKQDFERRNRINQMVKLHKLIKKKTILACIAIVSSFVYWIISAGYSPFSSQIVWDVMINGICVWLMFSVSDHYWKWLTNHGCCWSCYRNLNKWDKQMAGKEEKHRQEESADTQSATGVSGLE